MCPLRLSGSVVFYSFAPSTTLHEIIFILYESKESPVENERLHKPEPGSSEWREEKIPAARALLLFKAPAIVGALIQPHCCAEISRAPFGSVRHVADPHVVLGSDAWLDRCLASTTITTSRGPLPSLPKHSIVMLFVFISTLKSNF